MSDRPTLLLRDVEIDGRRADVRCADGLIQSVTDPGTGDGADVTVDGDGGALIPGLHDHHIHLLATAAALSSIDCAGAADEAELVAALRDGPSGPWIRAYGYHESIAGPLDRVALDRLVPDRPARVQHASGALWMLNSAGLQAARIDDTTDVPGVERDALGQPTGRLWRLDEWLRRRLPADRSPDLQAVGAVLARSGITGVTDTTPFTDPTSAELLAGAVRTGELPQRLQITGSIALPPSSAPELPRGPVKILLPDHDLPSLDALADSVRAARAVGRAVAIHCVTSDALVLVLAALERAGRHPGDRIEHGAVVLPALVPDVVRAAATVVTQPAFVEQRGDRYLAEVDPAELPHLWPVRSLLDAGVPVAAGSDAPYGPADPWVAVEAAVERRTRSGATLGDAERVDPYQALRLYLGPLGSPGGAPRSVRVGEAADLCVLDQPLASVLRAPSIERVVATVIGGQRVR